MNNVIGQAFRRDQEVREAVIHAYMGLIIQADGKAVGRHLICAT